MPLARLLLALVLAALTALALPVAMPAPFGAAAIAQDVAAAPDYAQWEKDAALAEQVLEQDRASNQALEQLRDRIVDWRAKFAAAQTANQQRISTLRNQIAALGDPPADGQTEAPEIASRRSELNDQLSKLQAPGIAAVEAHSRAEGIIREIDTVIRDRQADALLKLSPSPVNPINWPAGAAVLTQGIKTLWNETAGAWDNPARRTEFRNNLPVIILYLVVAAILVLRAPRFIEGLTGKLRHSASMRMRDIAASILSLGQVIVPVLGVLLLVLAVKATGMTGLRSGELIGALPDAAAAFFLARWLGSSVFSGGTAAPIVVDRPLEARFHAGMLGLAAAIEVMRVAFATDVRPPLSQAAQSVWAFPVVLLVAVFLFRLGQLIRRREGAPVSDAIAFRARLQRLFGTALVAASVVSPLLGVVGYVAAANALIWPALGTLALVGLVIVLHRFLTDVYLVASRSGEEGREALVPVLIGFLLSLSAVPVLALIWGARMADLTEAWTRFREGIVLGETRISPTSFLTLVAVFVIGYLATRLVQGALKSSVLPRTRLDKGVQNALAAGVGYVGLFLAALVSITAAGLDLSSLAIVAGALSVGIGFGLQNIVQNFVSGIILLIERPISEGDMIEVNGQFGVVKGISVRSTWIETFDRTDVIVPNGDLVSGVVTNLTRGNLTGRLILKVGVAYGTDTRRVEAILKEIADAQPLVLVDPAPAVIFTAFGADSLDFEVRMILSDVNYKNVVLSEVNHEIARRFAEEGIEIPFAQRDIWIRNPEALRGEEAPRSEAPGPAAVAVAKPAADPRLIHNDPSDEEEEKMSEPLFRQDAYLREAAGRVTGLSEEGGVILDATVFYPTSGGQPGDSGMLEWEGGRLAIATAQKGPGETIVLMPEGAGALPPVGTQVHQRLDWDRRHRHMRVHTALHLLSVVIPLPVTGGQIGAEKGRLDFMMPEPPADPAAIEAALNALIARDLPVSDDWISDAELAANPGLVKTMSVKPPVGQGRVRLVRIGSGSDQVDLQPCGGTHVARTGEIGHIALGKIENKGKQNRRVNILLAD